MKKGIFVLITILMAATIKATTIKTSTNKIGVNYRYNDAVTFVERGIQFHVFLNGDFDFDTHYNEPRYVDYYGRRTRANGNGVRIERDYRGRVRRVGNTFINYDARGNVKRIGNVFMRYRFGQLTNIGRMEIRYDRYGYPHFYGAVKHNNYHYDNGFSIDINIGDVCNYDDVYFYKREFRNNYRQFKEDDQFYYYRAVPNAKLGSRSKVLKRRKPAKEVKRAYKTYEKRNKREQKRESKRNR